MEIIAKLEKKWNPYWFIEYKRIENDYKNGKCQGETMYVDKFLKHNKDPKKNNWSNDWKKVKKTGKGAGIYIFLLLCAAKKPNDAGWRKFVNAKGFKDEDGNNLFDLEDYKNLIQAYSKFKDAMRRYSPLFKQLKIINLIPDL